MKIGPPISPRLPAAARAFTLTRGGLTALLLEVGLQVIPRAVLSAISADDWRLRESVLPSFEPRGGDLWWKVPVTYGTPESAQL